MRLRRFNILLIFLFNLIISYAQESKTLYQVTENILKNETLGSRLFGKLDSLRLEYIPSRSGVTNYFDRDIDFGYKHQRFGLQINSENFLIDILKENDIIIAKTIRHYYSFFDMENATIAFNFYVDSAHTSQYLEKRNDFYKSKKTIQDLVSEISKFEAFAFYCGDGLPKTNEGLYIESLVNDKNYDELYKMMQSICVERQAYGISGFQIIQEKGYDIPSEIKKIMKWIKKRNSETIICSGCTFGLIEKIYN